MQPYIKYIMGDGMDTFPWSDNWHPGRSILIAKGDRVMDDPRVRKLYKEIDGNGLVLHLLS